MAAILPSHMEASHCSSRFFFFFFLAKLSSYFVKHVLSFLHTAVDINTFRLLRSKTHSNDNINNEYEWSHQNCMNNKLTSIHDCSKWQPPLSVDTGVEKRQDSPFDFPWQYGIREVLQIGKRSWVMTFMI